ncbi:MAG: VOC family protein [Acidimicrobiales bacterium]
MPVRDSYLEGTPSWVDLATTEPEGAKRFYSAMFGWDFTDEEAGGEAVYTMATKDGHAAAGMMQQAQEQVDMGLPPMWNTYITVDDVQATVGRVESAGGRVMAPVMDVMDAGKMAVVVDPSGAVVCLWEADQHVGAEIVNEPGAFVWSELQTADRDGAAGFFSKLIGWDTGRTDLGPMGDMTLFKVGGQDVASAMDLPGEGVPPHWQVYFGVEDCDSACATATAHGGRVLAAPMDIPPGRMAVLADPAGAVFSIIAVADQSG